MMDSSSSKLFTHSAVEQRDELEDKYEKSHFYVQNAIAGLNDKDLHDVLQGLVCKHEKQHEDISLGLLYSILTDVTMASKAYRDLTLLTRDGLMFAINSLSELVAVKYQRLSEIAKKQLMWIIRELIRNQVPNVDNLVWNMLRQASGGDTSLRNLMLIEGMLDIFIEHRTWLEKNPLMVGTVCYTYVRLIEDHSSVTLKTLRDKEVKFIISLIRERFVDVMPLGRDFVRLLQNVARIPEFEALWKDILQNPRSLHPSFTEMWQLLQTRTSRRFLQCRLTPDMERKLLFLTSQVKFGNHKRYQDWFQDRYLNTPESHSLRSDFIRFIINAIHPTNDMLCSDIIPRWAIIGWLLTSCTNTVALANAKLAIFYDWLFFDPNKDNIMNVEPGILVMFHSIRNHPMVSTTLLDFLCRIMKNFYPKYDDWIRTCVYNTLRKILEKQVVASLRPLFESTKLDRDLKLLIRENFREFCGGTEDEEHHETWNDRIFGRTADQLAHLVPKSCASLGDNDNDAKFSDDEDSTITPIANQAQTTPTKMMQLNNDGGGGNLDEKEDTDDDDLPLSKVRLKSESKQEKVELPTNLQKTFDRFVTSKSTTDFESFLSDLRSNPLDAEQETYVHSTIAQLLRQTTPNNIFPESKTDDKLSESISWPIFALFKVIYQAEEKCKKCILDLLKVVYARLNTAGGLLLYFLKVYAKLQSRKSQNLALVFKTNVYKIFCDTVSEIGGGDDDDESDDEENDADLETQLNKDLAALETYNGSMFLWLLPDVYREFKDYLVNNSEALKTLVGYVDAKNLCDLVYSVTQGKLVIFKADGIVDCLRASLEFETFEQYCVWQLVHAHDIQIEYLQDLLPELETTTHPEALASMLSLLKYETPNAELIRLLLSRETKSRGDQFVTSVLKIWCREYEEKLSEFIANLLTSKYPINSPNKRKRPLKTATNSSNSPSSEQLLNHLEHFRRSCRHGDGTGTGLYVHDTMQKALQQAFSHSSDSQKKQFSDLFGLAAEDDTGGGTLGRRGGSRGRKQLPSKKESASAANSSGSNKKNSKANTASNNFNSDEEWSDDEWSKQKTPKRRKKAVMSDSD